MNKITIEQIAQATELLAIARQQLKHTVDQLQRQIELLHKAALPKLRAQSQAMSDRTTALAELLGHNPELFERPRSYIFHGIRVGYQKNKGRIEIPDPEKTLRLIKHRFADNPELLASLIHTQETPNKDGIGDLPVTDAKQIAVSLIPGADTILIRPADTEIDKLVKALLASALQEAKALAA